MNFELSEEELAIRDLARDFARDICGPGAAERDRKEEFPTEQIRRAAEFGLMGLLVPEEYGGAALSNVALSLALIEINKVDASVGVTSTAPTGRDRPVARTTPLRHPCGCHRRSGRAARRRTPARRRCRRVANHRPGRR